LRPAKSTGRLRHHKQEIIPTGHLVGSDKTPSITSPSVTFRPSSFEMARLSMLRLRRFIRISMSSSLSSLLINQLKHTGAMKAIYKFLIVRLISWFVEDFGKKDFDSVVAQVEDVEANPNLTTGYQKFGTVIVWAQKKFPKLFDAEGAPKWYIRVIIELAVGYFKKK
jgi:hypothetical protein